MSGMDLGSSIVETFKQRMGSVALGTYLFFWCVYHWQGIYVTLFVDQKVIYDRYGLLKNEYVYKYFFYGYEDWHFYIGIIIPLILTVLFIWLVTHKVLTPAYKQEQKYKVNKEIIKIREEERIAKARGELIRQTKETLDEEIEVADRERVLTEKDPRKGWDNEYEEFKKDPAFNNFNYIIKAVYEKDGRIADYDFKVPPGILALAHSRSLIEITPKDNNRTTIELTEKGKYFVSKYPLGR